MLSCVHAPVGSFFIKAPKLDRQCSCTVHGLFSSEKGTNSFFGNTTKGMGSVTT